MPLRQHILERLITKLEILLDTHVLLDADEDDGRSDEQGASEEHPVGDELVHEGDLFGVERPHHGCAGGLDALVETDVVGHAAAIVALPGGIVEAVEHVQEHGLEVTGIRPVTERGLVLAGESGLPLVASAPDGESEDEEDNEGTLSASGALEALDIEGVTKHHRADHLGEPVEQGVEGAGADVEEGAVDGVGLVGGEPVRGPEHGEEEEDVGHDARAVGADHFVGVAEEEGEHRAGEHEHDEGDVGAVLDRRGVLAVDVGAERDQRADHAAEVEDGPEPGEGAALFGLERVGHHDCALGGPEETGADTEERAGEVVEPVDLEVQREEQGERVDAVAEAAEGEGGADTETVDEGAGEETDDGKGAVQGDVLRMWSALSSSILS
ncbi:hypothetical protein V492_01934 [Pseudogymnoascus sp. VKM F-4246]|nr:hypothetical protein V492_01934 [Pseudogymnoascus sp. VKM F-4246]